MTRRVCGEAGMTLLELLIAMAIMLAMMGMAWSTFSSGVQLKRQSEAINERFHEIRVAQNRMVSDLSSAYISSNEDTNLEERYRYTRFVGKDSSDVDELRFSSMAHRVLWADANESDQTLISYFAEEDPDDGDKTNLLRRESRRLSNEQWEEVPAEIDVLLRDIKSVRFEYYDWRQKEWRKTWDSTKADEQRGRLPYRVRITITIENEKGDEVKFISQARLLLQEELKLFTN